MTDIQDYECTGTLVPNVTGTYKPFGYHNGVPSFKLDAQEWYLWRGDIGRWHISSIVGTPGGAYWRLIMGGPAGPYDPFGTATGIATMAVA